jgi:hypothetical protein
MSITNFDIWHSSSPYWKLRTHILSGAKQSVGLRMGGLGLRAHLFLQAPVLSEMTVSCSPTWTEAGT